MGKFNYDDNSHWREEKEDSEEPWKKAHEAWKAEQEREIHKNVEEPSGLWNEEQWDGFIAATDKEGLKVIAFYEKFWNHSDRDRMVEEAMAMYYIREAFKKKDPKNFKTQYFVNFLEREILDMGIAEEGMEGFLDAKENSLYKIPSYRYSRDFYNQIKSWAAALDEDLRREKIAENLVTNASNAYTKLSAGHVMGYQPHTIGGNISLTKRALRSMNRCLEVLYVMKDDRWFDPQKFIFIDEIALETRNGIALRLLDLRDQFTKYRPR